MILNNTTKKMVEITNNICKYIKNFHLLIKKKLKKALSFVLILFTLKTDTFGALY